MKKYFLTGMVILLPAVVTGYILWFFFQTLDNILGGLVVHVVGRPLPGVGFILSLIVIFLVGMVAANVLGRRLIEFGEGLLLRLPLVRGIYNAIKQLLNGFVLQNKTAFRQVVLIEYPRKGIYSLAFVTRNGTPWYDSKTDEELYCLFIPTTPNPTSGYMLVVPKNDLQYLDMTVEDALKVIISAGVVVPESAVTKKPKNMEG